MVRHLSLSGSRVSLLLCLLLSATGAVAQPGPSSRAQADALFERGKSALKAGDWAAACSDFQRSLELDESASTLVKLARCHEHDGHLTRAIAEYARALQLIRAQPASDQHARDLESLVQSAASALEARLGRVRVLPEPRPEQAVVVVDGQPAADFEGTRSDWVVPMDPGQHTIEIRATGYTAAALRVQVVEAQPMDAHLNLTRASVVTETPTTIPRQAAAAPPTTVRTPAAATADSTVHARPATRARSVVPVRASERMPAASLHGGRAQRAVGYVTGGVGIVLAGVAGYFGLQTRASVNDARSDNHCDGDYRCDRRGLELIDAAREQQTNAIISGVCGGILIGTGIVLVATAAPKRTAMQNPKAVAVAITPFGASLGGQW